MRPVGRSRFRTGNLLKSPFPSDRLLTIFVVSAYFFNEFAIFGMVVPIGCWSVSSPELAGTRLGLIPFVARNDVTICVPDPRNQPNKGQRSFNWQSIAFVMRRLWVQIPPLALFGFGAFEGSDSADCHVCVWRVQVAVLSLAGLSLAVLSLAVLSLAGLSLAGLSLAGFARWVCSLGLGVPCFREQCAFGNSVLGGKDIVIDRSTARLSPPLHPLSVASNYSPFGREIHLDE